MSLVQRSLKLTAFLIAAIVATAAETPKTYATPEEAKNALIQSASIGLESVRAMFGPASAEILRTGDSVQDQRLLAEFNRRAKEKSQLMPDPMNPDRVGIRWAKTSGPLQSR